MQNIIPCPLINNIVPPFKLAWLIHCHQLLPCIVVTWETTAGLGTIILNFINLKYMEIWMKIKIKIQQKKIISLEIRFLGLIM